MKIKEIKIKNFKRFTNLTVTNIPESVKLVVLVGPNGSGKTSFMESFNHFYKWLGFYDRGNYEYLHKATELDEKTRDKWNSIFSKLVDISFHDVNFSVNNNREAVKGHFYFRSAYRNEPSFLITSVNKQGDPSETVQIPTLIQNDQTVSNNYQRLITNTISEVFNDSNNQKSVEDLRYELIGIIQEAMLRVFGDLKLTSIGKPLENGDFYFNKGIAKEFSYQNLSAGEKSAFDLILDMVIKAKYFTDAIYCIDEPELHMHTRLQGKVLRELYKLLPDKSQLWISTHSIGMLQEAEEIETENPGTVVFLDFGNRNFDEEQLIQPTKIKKAVLDKFYELAFGDFAKLLLPKTIVFCEGSSQGNNRKNFDRDIYSTIFADTHPDAFFISSGSCTDIENIEETSGEIINTLLKHTNIIKIIDRDERSDQEISDLNNRNIRVLKKKKSRVLFARRLGYL